MRHTRQRRKYVEIVAKGKKPKQPFSLPQPPSIAQKTCHAMQRIVSSLYGTGIVGATTKLALFQAYKAQDIGFNPREGLLAIEQLAGGSEGELSIVQGKDSGRLFVLKRVRSNVWNTNSRANEARMLGYYIKPHHRVINMCLDTPDPLDISHWLMFMEYCSGGSLFEQYGKWLIQRRQHMPEVFLLHFLAQITEALAYLHFGLRYIGRGQYTKDASHSPIIHGDIKDENILLRWPTDPTGGMPELVLADFGTAKLAHDKEARVNAGTPEYNAPEDVAIHQDAEPCEDNADLFLKVVNSRTIAADMYSFGLVAHMVAARRSKPVQIGKDPSSLEILGIYKTPGILELVREMLVVDPMQRAEASFDNKNGILSQVHDLRKARDKMIATNGPIDPTEWLPGRNSSASSIRSIPGVSVSLAERSDSLSVSNLPHLQSQPTRPE